jgi:hypothetical protein
MTETLATLAHGSAAGYDLGCRSAGGCPNHDSAEWLTCREADTARRSDYALSRLPADAPIPRKALEIPKTPRRPIETPRAPSLAAPAPTPADTAPAERKVTAPARRTEAVKRSPAAAKPRATRRAAATSPRVKKDAQPKAPRVKKVEAPKAPRVKKAQAPKAARPAKRAPAAPRVRTPRQPVHGTVYGWRRGCRDEEGCPNLAAGGKSCSEVKRDYYADYRAARQAGGGPPIKHGTASGYQFGCRDRATCPGDRQGVTCPDASLAAEARRRRARGIPEKQPVVDSAPILEHIAALRDGGMTIAEIITRSGVSRTAIRALIYGRDDYTPTGPGPRHGEIPAHIEARKAQRILAVQPSRTVQLRGEPRRLQEAS